MWSCSSTLSRLFISNSIHPPFSSLFPIAVSFSSPHRFTTRIWHHHHHPPHSWPRWPDFFIRYDEMTKIQIGALWTEPLRWAFLPGEFFPFFLECARKMAISLPQLLSFVCHNLEFPWTLKVIFIFWNPRIEQDSIFMNLSLNSFRSDENDQYFEKNITR